MEEDTDKIIMALEEGISNTDELEKLVIKQANEETLITEA